jgi:hypothetical protein
MPPASNQVSATPLKLLIQQIHPHVRVDPTQVIARDYKGKPATAIAELTKKLSDLKGGKAHLERLTGSNGGIGIIRRGSSASGEGPELAR